MVGPQIHKELTTKPCFRGFVHQNHVCSTISHKFAGFADMATNSSHDQLTPVTDFLKRVSKVRDCFLNEWHYPFIGPLGAFAGELVAEFVEVVK